MQVVRLASEVLEYCYMTKTPQGRPRGPNHGLTFADKRRINRIMMLVANVRGRVGVTYDTEGIWQVHDLNKGYERTRFEAFHESCVVGIYQQGSDMRTDAIREMVLQDLKEMGAM
jgi:hypothetical protein